MEKGNASENPLFFVIITTLRMMQKDNIWINKTENFWLMGESDTICYSGGIIFTCNEKGWMTK
jgi:hypothetical protein